MVRQINAENSEIYLYIYIQISSYNIMCFIIFANLKWMEKRARHDICWVCTRCCSRMTKHYRSWLCQKGHWSVRCHLVQTDMRFHLELGKEVSERTCQTNQQCQSPLRLWFPVGLLFAAGGTDLPSMCVKCSGQRPMGIDIDGNASREMTNSLLISLCRNNVVWFRGRVHSSNGNL